MNKLLMASIVYLAAFFELSEDDVVDPDAAGQQLEQIAYALQHLTPDEQREFIEFTRDLAASEKSRGARDELVEFIRLMPVNFNMIEIDD
jgi:hypothetical protein